jgi:hypothetical protein
MTIPRSAREPLGKSEEYLTALWRFADAYGYGEVRDLMRRTGLANELDRFPPHVRVAPVGEDGSAVELHPGASQFGDVARPS